MLLSFGDPCRAWYLVRTKPRQEASVSNVLDRRGVETFVPRVLEPPGHRRAPRGPVALFPGYVFARCVLPALYPAVQYCPGGVGVVRFGERFAAVEDDFVEFLRHRLGDRGYLVMSQARQVPARGRMVKVIDGMFAGYEGMVERYLPAGDRVRLLLALVGGGRRVELPAGQVRCA